MLSLFPWNMHCHVQARSRRRARRDQSAGRLSAEKQTGKGAAVQSSVAAVGRAAVGRTAVGWAGDPRG